MAGPGGGGGPPGWVARRQLTKKKRLKTKRRYLVRLRQLSWADDIFACRGEGPEEGLAAGREGERSLERHRERLRDGERKNTEKEEVLG